MAKAGSFSPSGLVPARMSIPRRRPREGPGRRIRVHGRRPRPVGRIYLRRSVPRYGSGYLPQSSVGARLSAAEGNPIHIPAGGHGSVWKRIIRFPKTSNQFILVGGRLCGERELSGPTGRRNDPRESNDVDQGPLPADGGPLRAGDRICSAPSVRVRGTAHHLPSIRGIRQYRPGFD